jgi:hypothetical protein
VHMSLLDNELPEWASNSRVKPTNGCKDDCCDVVHTDRPKWLLQGGLGGHEHYQYPDAKVEGALAPLASVEGWTCVRSVAQQRGGDKWHTWSVRNFRYVSIQW